MVGIFDNIAKMLSMQREYIMVTSPDRDENSLQIIPPDRVERHQTEFWICGIISHTESSQILWKRQKGALIQWTQIFCHEYFANYAHVAASCCGLKITDPNTTNLLLY